LTISTELLSGKEIEMKTKTKLLLALVSATALTAGAFGLTACDDSSNTTSNDSALYAAYQTYKTNTEASNETAMSYEDWVASIATAAKKGDKGDPGDDGDNGKSAYEIYKEKNPTSTLSEEEWLASLKGEKGDTGAAGKSAYELYVAETLAADPDAIPMTEPQWEASLKGEDGKTAYELYYASEVKKGTAEEDILSETDWLASLKGEDGDDGEQGETGVGIEYVTYSADGKYLVVVYDNDTIQNILLPGASEVAHVHNFTTEVEVQAAGYNSPGLVLLYCEEDNYTEMAITPALGYSVKVVDTDGNVINGATVILAEKTSTSTSNSNSAAAGGRTSDDANEEESDIVVGGQGENGSSQDDNTQFVGSTTEMVGTTDAYGYINFTNVVRGEYVVNVEYEGYIVTETVITGDKLEVKVVVAALPTEGTGTAENPYKLVTTGDNYVSIGWDEAQYGYEAKTVCVTYTAGTSSNEKVTISVDTDEDWYKTNVNSDTLKNGKYTTYVAKGETVKLYLSAYQYIYDGSDLLYKITVKSEASNVVLGSQDLPYAANVGVETSQTVEAGSTTYFALNVGADVPVGRYKITALGEGITAEYGYLDYDVVSMSTVVESEQITKDTDFTLSSGVKYIVIKSTTGTTASFTLAYGDYNENNPKELTKGTNDVSGESYENTKQETLWYKYTCTTAGDYTVLVDGVESAEIYVGGNSEDDMVSTVYRDSKISVVNMVAEQTYYFKVKTTYDDTTGLYKYSFGVRDVTSADYGYSVNTAKEITLTGTAAEVTIKDKALTMYYKVALPTTDGRVKVSITDTDGKALTAYKYIGYYNTSDYESENDYQTYKADAAYAYIMVSYYGEETSYKLKVEYEAMQAVEYKVTVVNVATGTDGEETETKLPEGVIVTAKVYGEKTATATATVDANGVATFSLLPGVYVFSIEGTSTYGPSSVYSQYSADTALTDVTKEYKISTSASSVKFGAQKFTVKYGTTVLKNATIGLFTYEYSSAANDFVYNMVTYGTTNDKGEFTTAADLNYGTYYVYVDSEDYATANLVQVTTSATKHDFDIAVTEKVTYEVTIKNENDCGIAGVTVSFTNFAGIKYFGVTDGDGVAKINKYVYSGSSKVYTDDLPALGEYTLSFEGMLEGYKISSTVKTSADSNTVDVTAVNTKKQASGVAFAGEHELTSTTLTLVADKDGDYYIDYNYNFLVLDDFLINDVSIYFGEGVFTLKKGDVLVFEFWYLTNNPDFDKVTIEKI
jgi:hypothetical protein